MSRKTIALPVLLSVFAFVLGPCSRPAHATDADGATPPADTGTARVDFEADRWVEVDLDVHGVHVDRLNLHAPRGLSGLLTKHQEANRGSVVVTNTTETSVNPSLAIAVFDKEGHLLAAGNTGLSLRALKPGQSREIDVHLGGVFRHLDAGATAYISLEF
jgi:hypothetical protein